MKKTLLILLVLAFAVPAGAEIFVFNWKGKEVCYNQEGTDWETWKNSYKGYTVIETHGDTLTAKYIDTWNEKRSDGIHKLYSADCEHEFYFIRKTVGNKTIVILSTIGDDHRVLLTGWAKGDMAAKFTGNEIWHYVRGVNSRRLRSGNCSLSLNTKWTAVAKNEGFENYDEAVDFIVGELEKKGYELGEWDW